MAQGRMNDPNAILAFMTAGKATLTFVSLKTDERFTYKVRMAPKAKPTDEDCWFVSLLNGPDNYLNYAYIGIIKRGADHRLFFKWTSKSRVGETALSVKGFKWALVYFADGRMPANLEVWHEGKCGRCGRKLTVPTSIQSGFGPECVGYQIGLESVGINVSGTPAQQQKFHYVPQGGENASAVAVRVTPSTFGSRGRKAVKSIGGYAAAAALYAPAVPQKEHSVEVAIWARVDKYRVEEPENYWQDGELETKEEADKVAYNKFANEMFGGQR